MVGSGVLLARLAFAEVRRVLFGAAEIVRRSVESVIIPDVRHILAEHITIQGVFNQHICIRAVPVPVAARQAVTADMVPWGGFSHGVKLFFVGHFLILLPALVTIASSGRGFYIFLDMYCSRSLYSSSVSSAFVPLMMLYISSNVSHIHSLFALYLRLR